jgi:T5SS/PEP-CTERM-associated repeat protein
MGLRRHLRLLAFCAIAASARLAAAAHGEPALWANSQGGSFNTSANWFAGVVPGLHHSAHFELLGATYTTTFPTSVTNVQLIIGGNDVTFDLTGSTYTLYDWMGIDVGNATPNYPATLRVANGALVSRVGASVGRTFGAAGNVFVDGPSAAWNISRDLFAGQRGSATITIANGGQVSNRNAFMASLAGSASLVSVSGAGSAWNNEELHIGSGLNTTAELRLTGGTVTASTLIKIWQSGKMTYTGGQIVTPRLEIQGGTLLGYGDINSDLHAIGGTIEVPADQSLNINGIFSSGAAAHASKTGQGTLVIAAEQAHEGGSLMNVKQGTVIINTNSGVPATALEAAKYNFALQIFSDTASVSLNHDQDMDNLIVYFPSPGTQAFDLNGHQVRLYGAEKPEIWAAISNPNRTSASDPRDGIIDSALSAHPNSAIGLARKVDAFGEPHLVIRPTRVGDLNLDGSVTIADFIDLTANFGAANATWQEGDLNYDSQVTIADFINLAANFGGTYTGRILPISDEDQAMLANFAAAHGVSAVPEPQCLALLTLPLAMFRRRRK